MLPAVEMASPASVRNNKAALYNKICSVIWKSNFSLMFTSPRKLASSPMLMSSGNKSILFNLYSCCLKDLAAVETRCIMLKLELNPHIDIHVGWLLRYRELEERNVWEKKNKSHMNHFKAKTASSDADTRGRWGGKVEVQRFSGIELSVQTWR